MSTFHRNFFIRTIVLSLVAGVMSSCSLLEAFESTKIKRYKKSEYKDLTGTGNELVDVKVYDAVVSTPASTSKNVTLWTLSDRGQGELIKSIDKRAKTNGEFTSELEKSYFKEKGLGIVTDYTKKSLKLVFSVAKNRRYQNMEENAEIGYSPADRVEYLKLDLKLDPSSNIEFETWNKFETQYGTINIGDVSFNRSFSVTGGINASKNKTETTAFDDIGSLKSYVYGYQPSISATAENSTAENQKINYRYLALNGSLSSNQISMEQEGTREIDLAGNIIVDVSFVFDSKPETLSIFSKLFDKDGKPNMTEEAKLKLLGIKVPAIPSTPADITGTLDLEYIYRHVSNKRGRKTFYEWDDEVQFYENSKNGQPVTLFKTDEYVPTLTFLKVGSHNLKLKNTVIANDERDVIFNDYQASSKFLRWMYLFSAKLQNDIIALQSKLDKEKNVKKKNALIAKIRKLSGPIKFGDYQLEFAGNPVTIDVIQNNTVKENLYY